MELDKKEYVQVKEVLNNFSIQDKSKIPTSIINLIDAKSSGSNYTLALDIEKPLEDQISRRALGTIIYIVTKYIATNEQKNRIKEILVNNSKEFQESANERLEEFRAKNSNQEYRRQEDNQNLPVEIKKENFIIKIINKIKSFLKIKKRS